MPAEDQPSGITLCEHGARCGGCAWLGVPEPEQLAGKQQVVREALAPYPCLRALALEPVAPGRPPTGYRTRAKLMVSRAGAIGLYARGSHEVVDIPHCRVLGAELAAVVDEVRALARQHEGALASLDVREARCAGELALLVTLGGEPAARARLEALAREVAALPHVTGVAVSERDPRAPTFFGGLPRLVCGAGSARDSLTPQGPYVLATHGGFVQAHRAQAAAMASRVTRALGEALGTLSGSRLLELYAGSGALGLLLCQQGARCVLVEQLEPALTLAQQAAGEQDVTGMQARAGDALQICRALAHGGERFDAVIVNPPRRGLPAALREQIAGLCPRALAYVSCEPRTLARDLAHLAQLGYAAHALAPFDMMPLTDAVETLALLSPAPPPPIPVLYEDEELLAVDKPPHLPTTPQGEGAGSLLERVRAQRGLAELAAVHRLDRGTSGVCLLCKRRASVAAFSRALQLGGKHYTALARGVAREKGSVRRALREAGAVRPARTRYTRLELLAGHSLLHVRPDEGRTHQIRRHLTGIGHPVLGDARHGDPASNRHFEHRHGLDRSFLHLTRVELAHPRSGSELVLESALAPDLASVLASLRQDHG